MFCPPVPNFGIQVANAVYLCTKVVQSMPFKYWPWKEKKSEVLKCVNTVAEWLQSSAAHNSITQILERILYRGGGGVESKVGGSQKQSAIVVYLVYCFLKVKWSIHEVESYSMQTYNTATSFSM